MNTVNTFGDRVKELRKRKGLSQEKLAELLFLESKATISSYETNRRMPGADILAGMAIALETTVDYLLNGDVETNETINRAVILLQQLSPELQKVALEQIRILFQIER
ncbi:Helix-turn-helix domain-containing protein [Pseudobutyrivibrio sp. YE44]|uniref:helix-turn-helix domain-containing protein n=1 Tax=Pseudobutyrivibrio sp. YE44 TaxID=1520802 RepID=UPI000890EE9B|nr:helix-turn-helix transcriptional regulator [Pseudobutyrivibrio sp. YE44]SDB45164.1 Helix-turn-helix domain-containing protein [Pseudobutyrivibrio sp. YE44]